MKHSIATLAAAAALALALPAQAQTVTGSATPGATTVGNTGVVTLTVNVSEAFVPSSLTFNLDWAAGLALAPDASTAMGLSWAVVGGSFDPDWTEINVGPNLLGVSSIGLLPEVPGGSFTVEIAFTGLAVGTHAVSYELLLGAPDFSSEYSVAGTSAVAVAVPEASTTMMLAAGLAVMGLLARRRRA
jgi:hypothetical protein